MRQPASVKQQKGFSLISIMVGIMVLTILGIFAAQKLVQTVYESGAESTGKYLLIVRGATIDALSRHHDAFNLIDTSAAPPGTYPASPAWANFAGDTARITVADLKASGFLRSDFPDRPPMGRSVHIVFNRDSAACPGISCEVQAYVYTCWPITKARSPGAADITNCPAPSAAEYDTGLLAKAIRATDGFGGSNGIKADTVTGSLFKFPASLLGIPASSTGHLVVAASLNSTMYNQFVRQGDTRPIYLNNTLAVRGQISTDTGILFNTSVAVGTACDTENLIGTSDRNSMVACSGGRWFELDNHVLTGTEILANGQSVIPAVCPGPNMEVFATASIAKLDVTMTGTDVDIRGNMVGTIGGTGAVSQAGAVTVSGTYNGTVQSTPDSSIRTAQGVEIVGGIVVITPATAGARALVIKGCRYI